MNGHAPAPGVDLALRLTALELLLRPMAPWSIGPLLLIAAGAALLWAGALHSSRLWYAIFALTVARIAGDWPLADNHIYLLAYWTLALGLALGARDPSRVIQQSGRWLLAATFVMAVLWKGVLSVDYLDGRFFRITWLTDPRLEHALLLVGGLAPDQLESNRAALQPLPDGAELLHPPRPSEPARFRALVAASTWGVLALEASIALACLLPLRRRWTLARHLLILVFCASTYAFAPVAGFGWLLLAMGVASTSTDLTGQAERLVRSAYVVTWFLVLLYSEVPWAAVLVEWRHAF
jgi:hypothetical protein